MNREQLKAATDWLKEIRQFLEGAKGDTVYVERMRAKLLIVSSIENLLAAAPAVVTEEEFNTKLREWSTWKVWPAPFIMQEYPNGVKIIPTPKENENG